QPHEFSVGRPRTYQRRRFRHHAFLHARPDTAQPEGGRCPCGVDDGGATAAAGASVVRLLLRHLTRLTYSESVTEEVMECRLGPYSDAHQRWERFELRVRPSGHLRPYV